MDTSLLVSSNNLECATTSANAISFDLERKHLDHIDEESFSYKVENQLSTPDLDGLSWVRIKQVGRPLENSTEKCFSAMQKIISACNFGPTSQLLFYVTKINGVASIYLGLNNNGKKLKSFSSMLSSFTRSVWPGMSCIDVKEDIITELSSLSDSESTHHICALTGIPSAKGEYDNLYPATIDTLIAGMSDKDTRLLVIARPIQEDDLSFIINKNREISGALESLKSTSITEQKGESIQRNETPNNISRDEMRKRRWAQFKKSLPIYGNVKGPELNELLSKYITGPTTNNNSISVNTTIVNKHVEASLGYLTSFENRMEDCKATGGWSVGVYLISESESSLRSSAIQLRSAVSGHDSRLEPIRVHDLTYKLYGNTLNNTLLSFNQPNIYFVHDDQVYQGNYGSLFDGLTTVLSTKELSYYINFPLRGVPGISVIESTPEFSLNEDVVENGLSFGKVLFCGDETNIEYKIDPNCLTRHILVSGITGQGKTNTIQAILKNNVRRPFLIIEPAKTEYVDWAINQNRIMEDDAKINIFMPGCELYKKSFIPKKLSINPFEPVWLDLESSPNIVSHIDRIKSAFAAAFPMEDILPVLMEDLIYSIYQNDSTKWLGKDVVPVFNKTLPPTLNSMSMNVDKVIAHRTYEQRVQMNMAACLHTRIDDLKRGWRGELLNNLHSTDWKEVFDKPCIINLSAVGDEVDKAFIMSIILMFLYEYRTAKSDFFGHDMNSDVCEHLTIIEEAHRVMQRCDDMKNPIYKSSLFLSNMLSEIRAYGEGMVLVDQVPTRLISDAIKNTNLKILHRLVSKDDISVMSDAMGLNEEQQKLVSKLRVGQCIVSSSVNTDAYWLHVNKVK